MGWTFLIFGWRMEMRDDVKNAPWWCTGSLVRSVRMCEGVVEVRGVGKWVKGQEARYFRCGFNCDNQRMLKKIIIKEIKIS